MSNCDILRKKYPDRIPCIISYSNKIHLKNPKTKFLVPDDLTFGCFIFLLRKYMFIRPDESIFVFINNILVPSTEKMITIYENFRSIDDNFLYCTPG
jgi:GABA(A) receptor-associated protein